MFDPFKTLLLATGIMFTPISDDALIIAYVLYHLEYEATPILIWMMVWSVCILSFTWFYVLGRFFRKFIPARLTMKQSFMRAESFINRYGGWSILLSYFIPGIRHPLHYVAGFTQMKFKHYQLLDIISSCLYAGLWTLLLTHMRHTKIVQAMIKYFTT